MTRKKPDPFEPSTIKDGDRVVIDGKEYVVRTMARWLPKRSWTRAAPNVSKKLQIAKSKKKRVVSRAKATATKGKA